MRNKGKLFTSLLLSLGAVCLVTTAGATIQTNAFARGVTNAINYRINLNDGNTPNLPTEYSSEPTYAIPDRYVQLAYVQAKGANDAHCQLADGGYIKNNREGGYELTGIVSVGATFTGNLKLSYGIDSDNDFSVDLTSGNQVGLRGNSFKFVSIGETTITSITIEYSCVRDQYSEGKIEGLGLTRVDDENVVLNFTSQSEINYQARVDGGDIFDVVAGQRLALDLKEGEYAIDVRAKDPKESTISEWQSLEHRMTYWNEVHTDLGTTWTVWNVDDKPYGEGTVVFPDGAIFVGTFTDNWLRKEGKHTFTNGMYYRGKFVNDQYEDTNGEFSWQSYEGAGDGWVYKGGFVGGTPAGQTGNLYFNDYYQKAHEGIWSLEGVLMDGLPSFEANQTTTGGIFCTWFGETGNYNWYEGPINIDGGKGFNTAGLSGTLSIGRRLWHGEGLQYWSGTMRNDFWPTTDTVGYGEIQFRGNYTEWYEGDILHLGNGDEWRRHGIGTERWSIAGHPQTKDANFTWAWQNASQAFKDEMALRGCMQDKITAQFNKDYDGGWILGDGYWYILDSEGNPYGYVSGTWDGSVVRTGNISDSSVVTLDPAYVGTIDLTSLWVGA